VIFDIDHRALGIRRTAVLLVASVVLAGTLALAQQAPAPAPAPARGGGAGGGGGRASTQPANVPLATQGQTNPNGMRIYIRAGLKTHGDGALHDYPQFLADWSKSLTIAGAFVDGSYHAPTAAELDKVDVMVMFKGDAGYLTDREKADFEAFVKRGGGIVQLHDTLCGPDPAYYSSIVGGAKRHGEANFSAGELKYTITDKAHPIMQGMTDFTINDEAFHTMTWAANPKIHVLATVPMPNGAKAGEVVPQIWTYEHTMTGGTAPSRAFVWMQGHDYKNINDPAIKSMLMRGIAWAAKRPVNELVDYKQPEGRGGGRRGAAPK
jgi:type 1 glutamine amidotransferase